MDLIKQQNLKDDVDTFIGNYLRHKDGVILQF
jgi:hypothetical protein